jgi:hypothetical protein
VPKLANDTRKPSSLFDPRSFPWLKSERRITLQPPTPAEKRTHSCWYDKEMGFWVTQLFPLKLQASGGAASIRTWIDLTISGYFSDIAGRRRAVELAKDVRHLYLCALMQVRSLLEEKKGSVGLARIIDEVCHSLLELEMPLDEPPLSTSSSGCKSVLSSNEDTDITNEKPFIGEMIRSTVQEEKELRSTVLKQAQIMRELQAELEFQREARFRAEATLAEYKQREEAALKN